MMIQTNLLPEEFRKKERIKLTLPEIPLRKFSLIFFGVFFVAQLSLSFFAFYKKTRIGDAKKEIAAFKAQNRDLTLRKTETAMMKVRLKEAEALTRHDFFWSRLLNDISDSIPKGVWLTRFSVQEAEGTAEAVRAASGRARKGQAFAAAKVLRLEGSAVGPGQETAIIGKFIKELKENAGLEEIFQDVKLSDINQKKIRDADVYDFVLICVFKQGKSP